MPVAPVFQAIAAALTAIPPTLGVTPAVFAPVADAGLDFRRQVLEAFTQLFAAVLDSFADLVAVLRQPLLRFLALFTAQPAIAIGVEALEQQSAQPAKPARAVVVSSIRPARRTVGTVGIAGVARAAAPAGTLGLVMVVPVARVAVAHLVGLATVRVITVVAATRSPG